MKKLILFIVSFCFINVYAANDFLLQYEYKTGDTVYRVAIPLEDTNNGEYVCNGNILISKNNADTGGYSDPEEVKDLSYYLGTDKIFIEYGITSAPGSFNMHSTTMENFAQELKDTPIKYAPILMFNENDEPILFGSYFDNGAFEETIESGTTNVNNAKAYFEKILKGELTPLINGVGKLDFYDRLNLKDEIFYTTKSSLQNVNINDKENNGINWNASTCQEYDFLLKALQETIAGKDGNGGVCSANSLNKMQSTGSLYDLENNFDKSVLEPECANYVFGNGSTSYIGTIVDAQMYYNSFLNDTDRAYSLKCLSMQSRYLAGLTLLTTYISHSDNVDAKGCTLISDEVLDFIDELFDAFKIVCTSVCIFLCMMDAYKVIFSKTVDMSKFQSLVVKRIIALVVIFLLPVFISVVSDYINERYMKSKGDICLNVIGA